MRHGQVTIRTSIQAYFNTFLNQTSPSLQAARTQALSLLLEYLKSTRTLTPNAPVSSLQPDHIRSYVQFLQQTRSPETEHLYSRTTLTFYRFLSDTFDVQSPTVLDKLDADIAAMRRPREHTTPAINVPAVYKVLDIVTHYSTDSAPAESQRKLLQLLRDKAIVLLMARTGLRASETCELRKHQIQSGKLQFTLALSFPLPTECVKAISHYLRERHTLDSLQRLSGPNNLPLFARHNKRAGNNILSLSRWTIANIIGTWAKISLTSEEYTSLQRANQQITPQTLRHYFVISTLSETDDIETTRRLSRHLDPSTTKSYLPLVKSQKAG